MKVINRDSHHLVGNALSDTDAASMQLFQDELAFTQPVQDPQSTNDKGYPTSSVIMKYLFFGGPIGGGLIGLLIAIFFGNVAAVSIIPIAMIYGLGLGLIPALLTGIGAAYFKLKRSYRGLGCVAILGAVITIIYASLFVIWGHVGPSYAAILAASVVLGALSALLTGLFSLPKSLIYSAG